MTDPAIIPDLAGCRERFWRTDLERLALLHPGKFASMTRTQRLALGFSQREVARRCNLDQVTISEVESQKTTPEPRTIREIADALALNADDLRAEIAALQDQTTEEAA